MNFTLKQFESIQVSGIAIELSKSQKENHLIITNHWKYFNRQLRKYKTKTSGNWVKYAIIYKEGSTYYYMPCIPYNNVSSFKHMEIHSGVYAIFEHKGSMALINETLHKIYKTAIPNNSLNIDLNRNFIHFERYDNRFNWNKPDSIIDICIPLSNTN